MHETLIKYLPERAVEAVFDLIAKNRVHLKIVNERKTRHGDYRQRRGCHEITVNANLNKYRFLITLVHELAHLLAFEEFGYRIKPHGREWKITFQHLMLPLIRPSIFPPELLPLLARHFKNPKASSDTDALLSVALRQYDKKPSTKNYIFEIPYGSTFRIYNGKVFVKGEKRIKRYACKEINSGKMYIFQPHAEVELIRTQDG